MPEAGSPLGSSRHPWHDAGELWHPPGRRLMNSIPDKKYFKIGEVARIVGVRPHVIRYWESEFTQLRPAKSSSNQRIFARRHVELLLLIRALVHDEGFTLDGARRRLVEFREAGLKPADLLEEGSLRRDAVVALPPGAQLPLAAPPSAEGPSGPGDNRSSPSSAPPKSSAAEGASPVAPPASPSPAAKSDPRVAETREAMAALIAALRPHLVSIRKRCSGAPPTVEAASGGDTLPIALRTSE